MVTRDIICNITLNEVTLNNSIWALHGFNLKIINAIFPKTKLLLYSNNKEDSIYSVNILSSSFGQLKVSRGYNINISNCYIDGNTRLSSTLIDIVHCNLSITNFIFFNQMKHDKGPAIINAMACHINMINVNILQNYALDGLIWVSNSSVLQIENSMFNDNGLFIWTSGVLILNNNSVLFLSNCKCESNGAVRGPCIHASGSVKITAKKSIFDNNHAIIGGAVYWKSKAISELTSDTSRYNFEFNVESPGEKLRIEEYKTKLMFEECIFSGHTAARGGVFYVDGSPVVVSINNCIIRSNGGVLDTTFLVQGQHPSSTKLNVKGSFFIGDMSWGSGVFSIKQAHVDIHNSTISVSGFGLISVADYSIVNITHLSINQSPAWFGYIDIQNNVKLFLADSWINSSYFFVVPNGFFIYARNNCSIVVKNSQFGDGNQNGVITNVFGLLNFSSLEISNCTFANSNLSYLRLLTASDNSKVLFTECSFIKTNGFEVAHNSELHIKNSKIIGSTYSLQNYALVEIADNSHMSILNSSFVNNVLHNRKLMFVAGGSSLMINYCLYMGNDLSSHITALGGGNITISNTKFFQNIVRKSTHEPGGLLVTNGTIFTLVQ